MPNSGACGSVTLRALGVLAAFDAEHLTLSLSEIGRRSGLPLATAHRLVGDLTAWGALERDSRGNYRVGLRLWEIATLAPRSVGLREAAMPFLEDLYEATHENVQFAVLDGHDVVYVERISGRAAVRVRSRTGGRWPLHATGVGLVLLAHADPALQEEILGAPLRHFTPMTVTDHTRLRGMLAEIRRTGIAVSDRQITEDAISVAAPVYGARGTVVAAVSVVVAYRHEAATLLAPAVRAAGRGISRALGWVGATV